MSQKPQTPAGLLTAAPSPNSSFLSHSPIIFTSIPPNITFNKQCSYCLLSFQIIAICCLGLDFNNSSFLSYSSTTFRLPLQSPTRSINHYFQQVVQLLPARGHTKSDISFGISPNALRIAVYSGYTRAQEQEQRIGYWVAERTGGWDGIYSATKN